MLEPGLGEMGSCVAIQSLLVLLDLYAYKIYRGELTILTKNLKGNNILYKIKTTIMKS